MKEKGFTLTELLAVIILGITSLIVIPSVYGIIKSSKEKAYKQQVESLEKMAQDYGIDNDLGYENNVEKTISFDTLRTSGLLTGEVKDPRNGEPLPGCIVYKWQDEDQQYHFEYREDCQVNNPTLPISISFTPEAGKINASGWANSNFYVKVKADNAVRFMWCGTSNESCEPTAEVSGTTGNVNITTEGNTKICAIGYDKEGIATEKSCSDIYKLDKTKPVFNGLTDIVINQSDPLDLSNGVEFTDSLSGVNGSFTFNPTDVDRSKAGDYAITYEGRDMAGNVATELRSVRVQSAAPSITFTPESGKVNANGWSKTSLYVTINATDYSGHGIERIVWCGTTSNTCTPSSPITSNSHVILLENENNNHHICAYAVDKFGQQSETTCSEAYKIDKTVPTFTGIGDITVGVGGTPNLTDGVIVSDALSGINGTYNYSPTTIDTSKTGSYPVTYTVSDLAGNSKQITRNVIVTSGNPTINFTAASGAINGNGWAKANFYVTVNSTDYSGHGIEKIVWCGTTSNTCNPTTQVSASSASVLISTENNNNRICAYAIDKGGHTGSTTCSDAYKLDKTAPTISGLTNISVTKGGSVNLTSGVSASDSLSGMNGTFTYSPTSIDTSSVKTVTVTYTAKDNAGNTKTGTRTVTVTSPTLASVIQGSTIVTSGSGLYKVGSEYRYRGGCDIQGSAGSYSCNGADPVNNYISIGGQKYRIIAMDSQGVKVQTQSKLSTNMAFDLNNGNRNNANNTFCQGNDYCGVYAAVSGTFTAGNRTGTVTQNSSLYDYLNSTGTDAEVVNLRNKAKSATWNIGAVTGGVSNVTISTIKSQEARNTATFKMGLINASDYIQASLDTSCQADSVSYSTSSQNCRNNNWLFDPNAYYSWTINTWIDTSGNSSFVWDVNNDFGHLVNGSAYNTRGVRPVAYLNSNLTVTGGTGTASNPWVIQ